MKRGQIVSATVVAAAGLGVAGIFGWGMGASAHSAPPAVHTSSVMPHYTLSIDTPDMLGGTEDTGPAFVPSDVTLPANTMVEITIVNFDDATPLTGDGTKYATAYGIVGTMAVSELDTVNPNAPASVRHVKSLDPVTEVSHTFTIADLGVNVPLAPHATTTFRFHTGMKGTYTWRCMDPCGAGDAGWDGAMATKGYMQGSLTLA